jgi:hypothetical protein
LLGGSFERFLEVLSRRRRVFKKALDVHGCQRVVCGYSPRFFRGRTLVKR